MPVERFGISAVHIGQVCPTYPPTWILVSGKLPSRQFDSYDTPRREGLAKMVALSLSLAADFHGRAAKPHPLASRTNPAVSHLSVMVSGPCALVQCRLEWLVYMFASQSRNRLN